MGRRIEASPCRLPTAAADLRSFHGVQESIAQTIGKHVGSVRVRKIRVDTIAQVEGEVADGGGYHRPARSQVLSDLRGKTSLRETPPTRAGA